jgi:hypothetical protein
MPPRKKPSSSNPNFFIGDEAYDERQQAEKQKTQTHTNMNPIKMIISGVVLIGALVLTLMAFKIVTVEGSQLGVKETWGGRCAARNLATEDLLLVPGMESDRVQVRCFEPSVRHERQADG